jgi:hypothetical protein
MTDPRWPADHMRARLARLEDSWPKWNGDDHAALRGLMGAQGVRSALVEEIERIIAAHMDTDTLPPSVRRRLAIAIAEAVSRG